mmetsp:Transcript_67037/g.151466  ORF Transcript_67037/g.151466 Transcript_67037/m.151466 type:complete len:227 (-) Transcript_67037:123-803(-)
MHARCVLLQRPPDEGDVLVKAGQAEQLTVELLHGVVPILHPALAASLLTLAIGVVIRFVFRTGALALHTVVECIGAVEGRVEILDVDPLLSHVVRYDVHHDHHLSAVALRHELLEVIRASKVRVDLRKALGPVPVVPVRHVLGDRGDPYGVRPECPDVIQPLDDALEGAATVLLQVTARAGALLACVKPVGQDLVDHLVLPAVGAAVAAEFHSALLRVKHTVLEVL